MKNGDSKPFGTGIAFAVVVVLLLLWLGDAFHRKVDDATSAATASLPAGRPIGDVELGHVRYPDCLLAALRKRPRPRSSSR